MPTIPHRSERVDRHQQQADAAEEGEDGPVVEHPGHEQQQCDHPPQPGPSAWFQGPFLDRGDERVPAVGSVQGHRAS